MVVVCLFGLFFGCVVCVCVCVHHGERKKTKYKILLDKYTHDRLINIGSGGGFFCSIRFFYCSLRLCLL